MSLFHASLRALILQPVTLELPAPHAPLCGELLHASSADLTLQLAAAPAGALPSAVALQRAVGLRGARARVPLSLVLSVRVGGGAGAVPRALAARARALAALAKRQGRGGAGARRARGGGGAAAGGARVGLAWALELLGVDSAGPL